MTDQPQLPQGERSATAGSEPDQAAHPSEFESALALTEPAPEVSAKKGKIRRILASRVFQFALAAVILALVFWLLAKEIHPDEIKEALGQANLWWVLVAFLVGMLTWVGAATPFRALSSIRIPWKDAIEVQMASSFVGVAAPAGLGPVALHLDY